MMITKKIPGSLLVLIALSFAPALHAYDATVNWNDVRQRITGFGAGTGDANAQTAAVMSLAEPARTQALDLLFDSTRGIGLTMIRLGLLYTLQAEGGSFSITNCASHAALCQEAQKRGAYYFWSAPWTPPFWMKTVQTRGGGSLAPEHYQDFANYLSRYVRDFKSTYNIDIKGISVQNEPHFNPDYGGCFYSGTNIHDFVKNNLGPTFVRDNVKAAIIIPETNFGQENFATYSLTDTGASKYIGVCAYHVYEGARPAPEPTAVQLGMEVWESETSCDPWSGFGDLTMNQAIFFGAQIHRCMAVAQTNAWHYFELSGGGNPPIRISGGQYQVAKLLYTIGNYSRFVRPGWRMIGATGYAPDSLYIGATAYRDPATNKFAIVVVNWDDLASHDISFTFDGFRANSVTPWLTDDSHELAQQSSLAITGGLFSATLPPKSLATYTGVGAPISAGDVDVDSFTVSPRWIAPGGQATIAWSTANATSVSIDNSVGTVAASGTKSVSPSSTATYTLTAQGPNGPVMRRITLPVQAPREPENPSPVVNGDIFKYYEGDWTALPDFSTITPLKTGIGIAFYPTAPGCRQLNYGIRYEGYIDVPADGFYTFFCESESASKLYIGTTLVVNNTNGFAGGRSGSILLKAGKHAIAVEYLHLSGTPLLKVFWQAPDLGLLKKPVPATSLYRLATGVRISGGFSAALSGSNLRIVRQQSGRLRLCLDIPASAAISALIVDHQGRVRCRLHEGFAESGALTTGSYFCVVRMADGRIENMPIVVTER
jgi:glucuronoarabinoxylan endo-1,4-beta-xylanase